MQSVDPASVAAGRRRDLLQTFVLLGILFTPAWLGPAWFARPWLLFSIALAGPAVALSWTHGPWVPTPRADLPRILEALRLSPGDSFCDLGCGDGRMLAWVRSATGARCTGIEAAPLLVLVAKLRAWGCTVRLGDLYAADLSSFDVVYVWGAPYSVGEPRFRDRVAGSMRRGARLVSYQTPIAGLEPEAVDERGMRPVYTYTI
jgi:SAM-dependent methyltransferase